MRDLKLDHTVDKRGKSRWRLVAGNGKILARSPKGYDTKDEYLEVVELFLKEDDADAYRDIRDEWRWRTITDGQITGISTEGYKNKQDCIDIARKILSSCVV